MLSHPHMLGRMGELHRNEMLQEAERRAVNRQVASNRQLHANVREALGKAFVGLGNIVAGVSTRPPAQSTSAGA